MQVSDEQGVKYKIEYSHISGECVFSVGGGWSDDVTVAFKENISLIDVLILYERSAIDIPDLGECSKQIKCMILNTKGVLTGIEQFQSLAKVDVQEVPKNGIDFGVFPDLKYLRVAGLKKIEKNIPLIKTLKSLCADRYSREDFTDIGKLKYLKNVSMVQGRSKSLAGLEHCQKLQIIDLAYFRNLVDIQALQSLHELKNIDLSDLPKAKGRIEISSYPHLRFFSVCEAKGIEVDLSGLRDLKQLEKLWLNIPAQAIDWTDLFHLPRLRLVGLEEDENLPDDKTLIEGFERMGRRVEEIKHVGTRRSPHVQISLVTPCNIPAEMVDAADAREFLRIWCDIDVMEISIAPENLQINPEEWGGVLADMVREVSEGYHQLIDVNPAEICEVIQGSFSRIWCPQIITLPEEPLHMVPPEALDGPDKAQEMLDRACLRPPVRTDPRKSRVPSLKHHNEIAPPPHAFMNNLSKECLRAWELGGKIVNSMVIHNLPEQQKIWSKTLIEIIKQISLACHQDYGLSPEETGDKIANKFLENIKS